MGFACCHGAQDKAVRAQGGIPAVKLHHWANALPGPPVMDLAKSPTGIQGLDELTGGGLPTARPTLVCSGAGCGKTLLSLEFLVRGALRYGEPGVFMAFEETAADLAQNVASLGFNLDDLVALPALIKRLPEPLRSIVRDISNTERVRVGLDLLPRSSRLPIPPRPAP